MARTKKTETVNQAKTTASDAAVKTPEVKDGKAAVVAEKKAEAPAATKKEEKSALKEKKTASEKASIGKKTSAQKKSTETAVKTNIILQYAGNDYKYEDLIQNAMNKFQYDMGGDADAVKEISLYVKPDEKKVYFVMDNKVQGCYDM